MSLATKKAELKKEIQELNDQYTAADTPENIKQLLKGPLENARKMLEELEKEQDKPTPPAPAVVKKEEKKATEVIKQAKQVVAKSKVAKKQKPGSKAQKKTFKYMVGHNKALAKAYAGKTERQLKADASHKAKRPGVRISATGNKYSETRSNRSDISSKSPYLAKGGGVAHEHSGKARYAGDKIALGMYRKRFVPVSADGDHNHGTMWANEYFKTKQELIDFCNENQFVIVSDEVFEANKEKSKEEGRAIFDLPATFAKGGDVDNLRAGVQEFLNELDSLRTDFYTSGGDDEYDEFNPDNTDDDDNEAVIDMARGELEEILEAKTISKPKVRSVLRDLKAAQFSSDVPAAAIKSLNEEIEQLEKVLAGGKAVVYDRRSKHVKETEGQGFAKGGDIDLDEHYKKMNKYLGKHESFEPGTPVIYHYSTSSGQREEQGEVVIKPEGKGIVLYNDNEFVVPNWNNIETFSQANAREKKGDRFKITDEKYAKGGNISFNIGDIVFNKDDRRIGLVVGEQEDNEIPVIYRSLNNSVFDTDIKELVDIRYGYMDKAEEYSDISAYKKIAEKRGITLNPVYEELLEDPDDFAEGGRIKSALMRDRKYQSNEEWERNYHRASSPKHPHYKTHEKGGETDNDNYSDDPIWHVAGLNRAPKNFTPAAVAAFKKAFEDLEKEKPTDGTENPYYKNASAAMATLVNLVNELLVLDENESDAATAHKLLQEVGIYNYKTGLLLGTTFLNKELAERKLAAGGDVHPGKSVSFKDTGTVIRLLDNGDIMVRDASGNRQTIPAKRVLEVYATGGRIKSALMRDRKYESQEEWEQNYNRASRPRHPHYKKYEDGGNVNPNVEVQILAKEFSRLLWRDISKKNMDAIIKTNKQDDNENGCATHDYLDSNMTMDEAFINVTRRNFRFNNDEDTELFNEAWSLAKSKDFYKGEKLKYPGPPDKENMVKAIGADKKNDKTFSELGEAVHYAENQSMKQRGTSFEVLVDDTQFGFAKEGVWNSDSDFMVEMDDDKYSIDEFIEKYADDLTKEEEQGLRRLKPGEALTIESLEYMKVSREEYAKGGRTSRGLSRDRKFKSKEPHEQKYKRKTTPKNPMYKTKKAAAKKVLKKIVRK